MTKAKSTQTALRQFAPLIIGLSIVAIILLAIIGLGRDPAVTLNIFTTRFLGIFIEAAPFLLLGTLASGLIEAFITADDITRWIPRRALPATAMGVFMGFTFPVCECGVVPVARRLFNKGLPPSVGIAFLLAAPVMNPVVLVSTYIAFGAGPILYGRFIITAIVALVVGLVFAMGARRQDVLLPQSLPVPKGGSDEAASESSTPRKSTLQSIEQALRLAGDEFFEMGRYLIVGSMLAAAMQTVVSQDVLFSLGSGPIVSVIVMQILAFLLSVCSTVDAFLALAFTGTFTGGSILAFLTFGPMIDIKSTLMFLGVFKKRTVVYLIVLPLLLTMWIGVWLNLNVAF